MLLKKTLILTLTVAFSVHCTKGHAQEDRLSLLFALAVSKGLIEWYHFDIPRICFDNDMLLKPDTHYCFSPDSGVEAKAYSRAASDDSDSKDKGTSDENSNSGPEEDEADSETDVQCVNTTPDSFQALNDISKYCATLRPRMINQESISDSEIATGSEVIHLPADRRPKKTKVHQCDHEGCNYRTDYRGSLKIHKKTHIPADQRPKRPRVHQCDYQGCDYSTARADYLKKHKQIHLPADQRLKRPRRKAYDQPPSNKKRKKGDKE